MLGQIHRIPCSIEYNGSANVSDYFVVEPSEQDTYKASFRGRPWTGHLAKLDDSIEGLVLEKKIDRESQSGIVLQPCSDATETSATFSEFFLWEWGNATDTTSLDLSLARDWLDFSSTHLQFSNLSP